MLGVHLWVVVVHRGRGRVVVFLDGGDGDTLPSPRILPTLLLTADRVEVRRVLLHNTNNTMIIKCKCIIFNTVKQQGPNWALNLIQNDSLLSLSLFVKLAAGHTLLYLRLIVEIRILSILEQQNSHTSLLTICNLIPFNAPES